MVYRKLLTMLALLAITCGLTACKIDTEFDRELKNHGLLDDDGVYKYGATIGSHGNPPSSPSTAIKEMIDCLASCGFSVV